MSDRINIEGRIATQPDVQLGSLGAALKSKVLRDQREPKPKKQIVIPAAVLRKQKEAALAAMEEIVLDHFAFEAAARGPEEEVTQ